MDHARLRRMISGEAAAPVDHLARLALTAVTPAYRLAVAGRNRLFDAGLRRPVSLGRPVISVGNLTVGGTGKTPMVLHLVHRLLALGGRPAILTRGYHGGDEARQMRGQLPDDVPIQVNPDRAAGARSVLQTHPRTTVFVLDDGFQHRQVHRDLDLVLIDATNPLGYGRLLPRGLLREPACNLRRADATLLTRADQVTAAQLAQLDADIASLAGTPPLAHAAMRWDAMQLDTRRIPPDALRHRRIMGICAIGNPAAFERTLRSVATDVVAVHTWPDHHLYTPADRDGIAAAARDAGVDALVMTEKDWVKWSALPPGDGVVPPVYRPVLSIAFTRGGADIDAMLRRAISPATKE